MALKNKHMRTLILGLLIAGLAIQVSAQQERGLKVERNVDSAITEGTTYAFIVGISLYANINSLKYADSDAALFRNYLLSPEGGNAKIENIKYLVNDSATGGSIAATLSSLEELPYKPGDKLYIYMAGHGDAIDQDEYYFLGSDLSAGSGAGDKNNYRLSAALRMADVKTTIKRIVKKNVTVVFILDACRTHENLPGGADGPTLFANGIIETPVGEIMMLSAGPGQSALESPEIGGGHGLFTWYLVKGLYGAADYNKDNAVTLSEMNRYLIETVTSISLDKFKHDQNPVLGPPKFYPKTIGNTDSVAFKKWKKENTTAENFNSTGALAYNDNRGIDSIRNDTNTTRLYNGFVAALKNKKLNGSYSAEWYFDQLRKNTPSSRLTNDARYTLAGVYLNYVNAKINIYLEGNDKTYRHNNVVDLSSDKNTYNTAAAMPFYQAAAMMGKAMELLKNDSGIIKDLTPKYLFLKARSATEPNSGISYDAARPDIKKAKKLQPNAAYLYNCAGLILEKKKKYAEAETEYQEAIELAPKWSYPYCNMGNVFFFLQDYDKAETYYQQALNLDSTCVQATTNYALINEYKHQNEKAIKYFYKAIVLDSMNWQPYGSLGDIYRDESKLEEAQKWYRKAISIDSNEYDLTGLGDVFRQKANAGDTDCLVKAVSYYNLALKFNPKHSYAYSGLAFMADLNKNYKDEEDLCKQAIKLNASNVDAYTYFGNAYNNQGKLKDAILYYKKALHLDPNAVDAIYNLACCYSRTKDAEHAIFYLEIICKNNFTTYDGIVGDHDLDNIRTLPKYIELMKKYFNK